MWMQRFFSTAALLVATVGGVSAQAPASPPAATAPPATSEQACTPSEAKPHQGTIAPREGTGSQNSDALGDRLAQSDGVICPPGNVDPKMRAPAPDGGPMPVIPPPGSPGGDQSVRPK